MKFVARLWLRTGSIYTAKFLKYNECSGEVAVKDGRDELFYLTVHAKSAQVESLSSITDGVRFEVFAQFYEKKVREIRGRVKVGGRTAVPRFVKCLSPGLEISKELLCSFFVPKYKLPIHIPPGVNGGPSTSTAMIECCLEFDVHDRTDPVARSVDIRTDIDCLSDVVIEAPGGSTIRCHKAILSLKSRVFAKMLTSDMQEKANGHIRIDDFGEETVKSMVDFIYDGKLDNSKFNNVELLKIADKYEVEELKLACVEGLLGSLSKENAGKVLFVADMVQSQDLKDGVEDFIIQEHVLTMHRDEPPDDDDDLDLLLPHFN